MQLTAVLANHAEAQNNLLYISGGGIDRAIVATGSSAPFGVTMGIGILVTIPWTDTNREHALTIHLVDPDGRPVLPAPEGTPGLIFENRFTVGRPPGLKDGDEQGVAVAVNMPGLPMPRLGDFAFVIAVNGQELKRLPYRVMEVPAAGPAWGAASIPDL